MIKRAVKIILAAFLALCCILVSSCNAEQTGTAVLNCMIEGDCDDLTVIVYPKGAFTGYLYPEHEGGRFRLEIPEVDGFVDFAVAINEEVYGAHVNAGDSLSMACSPAGEGKYDIVYTGATERESRIFTDFYNTYGYWGQYNIRPDRDPDITTAQSLAQLAANDSSFRAKYGAELDHYQAHYADLCCLFLKSVLLEFDCEEKGVAYNSLAEYREIYEGLDPNDPYVVSSLLINRWAFYLVDKLGHGNTADGIAAFVKGPGRKVRSAKTRAIIAKSLSIDVSLMADEDNETVSSTFDLIASYIPGQEELVEEYRERYKEQRGVYKGMSVPDITLRTPEGETVRLSSMNGKFLYIDIWATWCGPCVKETPYLAALVTRYKDYGDRIAFLSLSCDDDDSEDKWLAKLTADAPTWPQYRMPESEYNKFASALGIHAIPRFVVLDPDGKLYEADAPRPSDESIDDYIRFMLNLQAY